MDASEAALSVLDLPTTVLSLCLEKLTDPRDLATACCVCRAFRDVADDSPIWESFIRGRWRHWDDEKYAELRAAGAYKAIYPLKLEADRQARAALESIVFPLKRSDAIIVLTNLGADAKDAMPFDVEAAGSANIGRQYWGRHAFVRCNAALCAKQLRALLEQRDPDVLQGALLLARALEPGAEAEHAAIPERIAQMAAELRRRMEAAGAGDDLQGLKLLKQLLSGERPGGFSAEDALPPRGAGLQLRGNREDYYHPDNSLLHRVFQTGLGIPISLSVIAVAVGRAAGLSMFCVGAPGHFVSKLAPEGTALVYYLDAFEGTIMDRQETQQFLAMMGAPAVLPDAPPSAVEVLRRMAMNLLKIFAEAHDFDNARTVSELMCAIEPDSGHNKINLAQMCLVGGDPAACISELRAAVQHGVNLSADIATHVMPLVARAEAEQKSLVDEAATRRKRSSYPAVQHRVGDVIRHKRYNYKGVVYGWDFECKASDQWIQQMNVNALPGGRKQPFYNVLVDPRNRPGMSTYVAQENVEVQTRADGEDDDSFLVQSSEVGEHFDGIEEGGSRYLPNAYRRMLFPED